MARNLESDTPRSNESGESRLLESDVPPSGPGYTEVEWSLKLQAPAVGGDTYEFRVYAGSTPLETYVAAQLGVAALLVVQDATHGHTAANVAVGVDLVVQGAAHAHTADNTVLTQTTTTTLVVANGAHSVVSGYGTGTAVQAVRFDALGDGYTGQVATGLGGAFTVAGWFRIDVDRDYYSTFWSIDNGSSYNSLITDTNGTTLYWAATGGGNNTGHSMAVGAWYYIACVFTGTAALDQIYYSVGTAAFTLATADVGAAIATNTFQIGKSGFTNEWLNGSASQVRVWSVALTQVELEAERVSAAPVRTANIWAAYSFASGPQTNDESGNGRTLTTGGTPTAEASGPPLGGVGDVPLGVSLVVQNAAHAHTADNVTTNYVVLAPANAAHAHVADNVGVGVNLVVAAAAHTSVSDNVVLDAAVATTLVVANSAHAVISGYMGGAAAPPYLFSEDWNTADDTHWDFFKWPHQRPFGTINAGRGFQPTGGGPTQIYSDQYLTDFEMKVKVSWDSAMNGQYPEIAWRMYDSVASSNGSGYIIQLHADGLSFDFFRVGAYSWMASATDASLNTAGDRWFKIRVVGHNHKIKWWNDGSAEPGTWQIDVTDATPQVDVNGVPVVGGTIGFRYWGASAYYFDDLTITDLASPPLAPDGSLRMMSHGKVNVSGSGNIFAFDTDLSWCGWFKIDAAAITTTAAIIALHSGGNSFCNTTVLNDGSLRQYLGAGGTDTTILVAAPGTFVPNVWYFVAMSRTMAAGTDVYWAPQGGSLTKVHGAGVGQVTNLPLRILSDDFGCNPYIYGCAFKVWKEALTQTQIEAEMGYYSAQRTINLFGSWPMKNGMDWRSENPTYGSLDLWWEAGGIVSGPVASFLLDAPVPLGSTFFPDIPLGVNLVVQNAFHAINDVANTLPPPNDAYHAVTSDNVTITHVPAVTLVVADGVHTHTAANIAVGVDITVNPANHASTSDPVALNVDLYVQSAAQAHTAGAPVLYPVPNLVVASAAHVHLTDNVALGIDIAVQGAAHAHSADNVVLNYVVLAPANAAHAITDSVPAFVVEPAVQSAAHAHTAGNVDLVVDLAVQSATHGHFADNLTVAGAGDLIVQSALHNHSAANVAPLNINMDGVQSAVHAHTAANVAIDVVLVVQSANHAHVADNTIITPALVVASAAHAHTVDNIDFTTAINLTVASATHTTVDNLTLLTQVHVLTVADGLHAHTAANTDLTQVHNLVVQGALHAITSTQVSLAGGSTLLVADSLHGHTADTVLLSQVHVLVVASASHAHTADNTVIYVVPVLVVADALHAHSAANVTVNYVVLTVANAAHAHTATSIAYTQVHELTVGSALHTHTAEVVVFFVGYLLAVQSARHAHYADGDLDLSGATVLNNADALFLGAVPVLRVYQGALQVWP